MQVKAFLMRSLIGVLVLVLTAPAGVFAQRSEPSAGFTQEELDQMLAPIALYPDSLIAQVLVAATYPEQVAEADQWLNANSGLEGDRLNDAVDTKDWDLSVKALVPFPKVLDMMNDKREWTQNLGEAFLAQEADVMDTIQSLRSKAYAQGNLKTTEQQRVVVKGDSIEIEPYTPTRIYVPVYNPVVVYGPWWYPSYPPFAYSPWYPGYVWSPGYVVPGFVAFGGLGFGFAAGIAVGGGWHHGWGHWDWGRRSAFVNVNRTVNINRTNITNIRTTNINRAVQQGKIGSPAVRNAAQQRRVSAAKAGPGRQGVKGAAGAGKRPSAASVQQGLKQREGAAKGGPGKAGVREGQAGARGGKAGVREGQAGARGGKAGVREGQAGARGGKAGMREGQPRGQGKEMRRGGGGDRSMQQRERGAVRGGGGGKELRGGQGMPRGGGQGIQRGGGGGGAPAKVQRGGGGGGAPAKAQRGGGGEKRERKQ